VAAAAAAAAEQEEAALRRYLQQQPGGGGGAGVFGRLPAVQGSSRRQKQGIHGCLASLSLPSSHKIKNNREEGHLNVTREKEKLGVLHSCMAASASLHRGLRFPGRRHARHRQVAVWQCVGWPEAATAGGEEWCWCSWWTHYRWRPAIVLGFVPPLAPVGLSFTRTHALTWLHIHMLDPAPRPRLGREHRLDAGLLRGRLLLGTLPLLLRLALLLQARR
jgi:hypothetical protein